MKRYLILSSCLIVILSIMNCDKKNATEPNSNYVYQTIKIGNQVWMAKNLKVTHNRNGDKISNVTDKTAWTNLTTSAYCNYENDVSYVPTYGRLYNWYAVNDRRNIAPSGWHVPSDEEMVELAIALGMSEEEANKMGFRGTDEGNKMKEDSTAHWKHKNYGTNESGFTALPAGCRYSHGVFAYMGEYSVFWSSTEDTYYSAWQSSLNYLNSGINRVPTGRRYGFSVRCIKD